MNDNKMWALVKEKPEQGLWLKRVQIPEVGPNDVKIKIHKNAICGTDVHIYQWNEWAQHTIPIGLTAGHEYVGEVVEVGAGVQGFKVGDLVSGEGHITCGKCRNCIEFQKGSHPDIIEIDAASNNGVDEVRSLIEKVKYAPMEGKYKVYIIDEVHMMSTGAFNALLKTIEEPPAHVIFIFATTEPHKVLPTIISRCQRFDFNKVSAKDMIERIHYVLDHEQITMEEDAIRIIAALADAEMRDALSILDQCIAYAQNNITVQDVNMIYGITTPEEKGHLIELVLQHDCLGLLEQIESLNEEGTDIKRLTSDLIDLLKESIIYSYTSNTDLVTSANLSVIQNILNVPSIPSRFGMLDVLIETYEKYRNASDVTSYFELSMLKLLEIDPNLKTETTQNPSVSQQQSPVGDITLIPSDTKKSLSAVNEQKEKEPLNVSRETFKRDNEPEASPKVNTDVSLPLDFEEKKEEKKTSEKKTIKKEKPLIINDDFVIRLLTGANKQERQMDDEKFRNINAYLNELEWAKYANAVKNIEIVASGKNYIVVCTESLIEAKEINQIEEEDSFVPFMDQLLGISKKIFAVDAEQRKRVIAKFKELMIQGNLPEPVSIEIKKSKEEKEKEMSTEEKLMDLFGDDLIIMEE